jgi:hypothetical protein
MAEEKISALLITGLLAILGTVGGGVVKGYWDTQLASEDFQSKLILRALESADDAQRIKSLQFLVKTNLISNPLVTAGINQVIKEGPKSIPQFVPVNAVNSSSPGVNVVPSVKAEVIAEHPELKDSILALAALRVRHGDVVDSITPILAQISPDNLKIVSQPTAPQQGGTGGGETLLEHEGYLITRIDVYLGEYFGRKEVIQLQVFWNKLTSRGIDAKDRIVSDKLGSGNFARNLQPAKILQANPGYYISDLSPSVSTHTDGSTFLNDISFSQQKLPVQN